MYIITLLMWGHLSKDLRDGRVGGALPGEQHVTKEQGAKAASQEGTPHSQ